MSGNNSLSKQSGVKSNIQYPCNSWVFLFPEEVIDGVEHQSDIETLRHPSTREAATFLFSQANGSVYEILTYSENKRSWFIDDAVKSDGRLKISTPIDPVFLVLPYLRKHCTNQAVPLDQILHDEKYPATERLVECDGIKYLTSVGDKKECNDVIAYKYNEEKTLSWLKKKTDVLTKILKEKNIHLTSEATSATFIKVTNADSIDNNVYLRYAAGMVSDYLEEDLSEKLLKHLDLPEMVVMPIKRKSDTVVLRESKKIKSSEELPLRNVNKAPPSKSANAKRKLKVASNMKSITSFFKKN